MIKKNSCIMGIFIFLLVLFVMITSSFADISPLKVDDSHGPAPLLSSYGEDGGYEDESIKVILSSGRIHETDYWVGRITISYPSQLRTASASGFESSRTMNGLALYRRMKAVLAINGDYFSYIPDGYLVRQGTLYRDLPSGKRDILLVDDQGDFYPVPLADETDLLPFKDLNVVNSFNFGPALVIEGKRVEEYFENNNAAFKPRQRMAVAQVERGRLEYVVVACAGPRGHNTGLTLEEFSKLVFDQGVDNAYNLDGGYSTMLMFDNAYINTGDVGNIRPISDIIYFASAVSDPGERQDEKQ
ncbi:MAG: phosphodiester glycosidase family protein [Clostridiales bacterium]|nr:phosphodiester glycosidase family protein [Clostridiales bacterium]